MTTPQAAPAGRGGRRVNGRAPRAPGAVPASLPRRPGVQLATLARSPPAGEDWLHEIKFDGYRIQARIDRGRVELLSRQGKDWTARFPEIAASLGGLGADAVLDGEVVVFARDGTTSFRDLQEALGIGRTEHLVYHVFDLLYLDGLDLRGAALIDRKLALAKVLDGASRGPGGAVRFTDHVEGNGRSLYDEACRLGLEGIVSKHAGSRYRAGRTDRWIKSKCTRHEELVIGGFTDPGGARPGFGALLLGAFGDGALRYVGKVGTGFNARQLRELRALLDERATPKPPFASPPAQRGVHWVRPELVAEVEFTEWTRDGLLRHPTFRGLREDREPEEIVLDAIPEAASRAATGETSGAVTAARPARRAGPRSKPQAEVAGVTLTSPERVLYPEQGVTKLALAEYYETVADLLLPGLVERPLSLLRCPEGRAGQCFFQKHPSAPLDRRLPRIEIREKNADRFYLYLRALPELIALVQAGTLELHCWGSRIDDLEHPDTVVFDLDPGPGVAWRDVNAAAVSLRDRLLSLDLASFVRTTGGKGLHLVVPLTPALGWDEVKRFARGVAIMHAADDPKRLTANLSKAKRRGRIFIDYLRNGRGATAIASYSTRARPGAPVAVPLRWDELGPALTSDKYTVGNLRRRLGALGGNPWSELDAARRPLTKDMLAAVETTAIRGGDD